jgi:tetratricopeptide (TPR) repeat protein
MQSNQQVSPEQVSHRQFVVQGYDVSGQNVAGQDVAGQNDGGLKAQDLYSKISQNFSPDESVQVMAALLQDPLVWQSLAHEDFFQSALDHLGRQVLNWSPGRLALLALGESQPAEVFRAEPLPAPGQGLQERALQIYQSIQRAGKPPSNLSEAALLALALRERRRMTGSWNGLLQEISPNIPGSSTNSTGSLKPSQASVQSAERVPGESQPRGAGFDAWRTALACLYTLIPDPEEMLRGLLPRSLWSRGGESGAETHSLRAMPAFDWIVHIQLSQPVNEAEHIRVFARLLHGLPVPFQLGLLRSLNLHGRERAAAELARQMVIGQGRGHPAFASLRLQMNPDELDLAGLANRALALQQMGAFYQLAGDQAQALALLNAVELALRHWVAGLFLQRLDLQLGQSAGDATTIQTGQLDHLAAAAGWLDNALGAVLLSHPCASSVLDRAPGDLDSALIQIKRALQMFQSDPEVARDLARQSVAGLVAEIQQHGLPFSGDFVYTWRPEDALEILLKLDLPEESARLAQALLETRPTDTTLLHLASRIYERLGETAQAIHYARGMAALCPDNPAGRRQLARLWEKTGEWTLAFTEWQAVLALSGSSPSEADRLACAQAALQTGDADQAVVLSEAVIQENANNGAALGILGRSHVARGESDKAVPYLVRATLLAPEMLSPWLALARVQARMGESRRVLETLRAAVTAVPEAPEGHLALGEACVDAGLLAEALPHLKKAFSLSIDIPQAVSIQKDLAQTALLYGRTLRTLGHSAESRAVLEKVRPAWTACPDLAYEYAQVLLDMDDSESALPVLESALHEGLVWSPQLPVLEASLLYVRILLGEYRSGDEIWEDQTRAARLQQAYQALLHILEATPDHLEARFLMADTLREQGQLNEALVAYRALADLPQAEVPEVRWRVQWGVGRTALMLGQNDLALAALKEACQYKPESLAIQRSLAEASLRANLTQEALEAAANVLHLAPDHVETLSWFADFVTRAGELRQAVEALERAVQLDPDRTDLLVSLASGLASAGELAAARSTLEKVMATGGGVGREDLRRAAHVYLRLGDPQPALACYERAVLVEPQVPAALLVEVAQLHQSMENYDAALSLVQQALERDSLFRDQPESLPVHLLQADLLAALERPQAALAVLERALRVAQSVGAGAEHANVNLQNLLGEVHDRFTRLMIQIGDLPSALHHAEKSLSMFASANAVLNASLCYRAADLALAQLQIDRAARILRAANLPPVDAPAGDVTFLAALFEQGRDGLSLLSLQVEMVLKADSCDPAAGWIEAGLAEAPGDARLLAAKARWLAHQGNLFEARKIYRYACQQANAEETGIWMAEAALAVQSWKDVPGLFERCAHQQPGQARAQLGLARALVLCAEQQRLCEATGSRTYAPGASALSEESQRKFEEAIQAAGRLINAGEIGRWQARGQAIFAPSAQSARALASMPSQPEDIAALVAVLRQLNNRAAAIQVARRFADHPLVLLQLALCYQGDPSGSAVAERAASVNPNQPLAQATLGMLARQAGELTDALDAYENAILLWPDEPTWHDSAGELCLQVGNLQAAIAHFRRALDIEPDNPRFAFKLGQACLSDEGISGAITFLEKSVALDPAQADAWLTLATAYHLADRLPQALEAARKAGDLNSASAEALLIAGETALSMNQAEQALELAQSAVRREPENAAAVLFLSNVLVQCERAEEGLKVIEQTSPTVRAFFPVAFERAKLIHRLHGAKAALEVLEKLVREYPEEPDLLGFLARVQAECGEVKAAERYAFRALRLDPNQPELTLMLGRLNRKNGHLDQAVHLLGEVIRLAPDHLEAYLELGSVYQERREYALALQAYRQAIRVAPGDYQAYYQCGLILRDSKDYTAAESMLRRAAELAPDNLSIRRQLVAVIALNLVHHKQEVTI